MQFVNQDKKLSVREIETIEGDLGITFPDSLRDLFANHNGGEPDPYVFQEGDLQTIVNETLPLISEEGRGTAVRTYQLLVVERQIVEKNFFPFAVDAGGDYFFVDCGDPSSPVYFYRSDGGSEQNRLVDLRLTLGEFWDCLQPED